MAKNKHSLLRTIPPSVKLAIRQRCGYGCILCGNLFCQYHHFNPPFSEAREHKAEGITLLCTKHHDDFTHKRLSTEMIEKANSEPYCLYKNNPHYLFEDLKYPLEIAMGGIVFISPNGVLLRADNAELFTLKQSSVNEPPLLSAEFHSINGEQLKIVDNEVIVSKGNWDINTKKSEIIVKSSRNEVFLHLIFTPPKRLQIIKIIMSYGGHVIDTEFGGKLYVRSNNGATIDFSSGFVVTGGSLSLDSAKGIVIDGGCFVLGAESQHAFGGDLDHLFEQVRRLQEFSTLQPQNIT